MSCVGNPVIYTTNFNHKKVELVRWTVKEILFECDQLGPQTSAKQRWHVVVEGKKEDKEKGFKNSYLLF